MLPASFIQTEDFWHNIAVNVINLCVDCKVNHFTYRLILLGAGGLGYTQAYTKRNMLREVDHIGQKFVKYCRRKLAGSIMKYWLCFMAHVG